MSIKKAYNIWAEQYDSNDNKTRDLDKVATIDTLTKFSFRNVLELGCGTGKNTTWLVKNAKSIIALDFSQEMLGKAKAKIQDEKKLRFAHFSIATAHKDKIYALDKQGFLIVSKRLLRKSILLAESA